MSRLWRRTAIGVGLAALSVNAQQNWAVIVAGSSGFINYRHQADVCHAYHIVRRNGIPDEQVIVMSYGDAADSEDNPIRGTLYNKPTPKGVAGYDVNRGCKLTYSGEDVTGENFLAVLKGDNKTTEGKPVLKSTKDDRVFVYFADHGAVGLVAMPVGEPVYAQDLMDALRYMWTNEMYKELVFYMEACESGSMFQGLLPTDVNIYATTAANSHESSWGTYCGDDSSVDGTIIGSCLGDLYSVNWLENSDVPAMFHTETLDSQFAILKNETVKSHVQKFGTSIMGVDPIEWFQGAPDFPSLEEGHGGQAALVAGIPVPKNAVGSRSIKLHTLKYQLSRARSVHEKVEARRRLLEEVEANRKAIRNMITIVLEVTGTGRSPVGYTGTFTEHSCLKAASTAVTAHCGPWDDFSLEHVRGLANLCQGGYSAITIEAAAKKVCRKELTT